jgi:hypothetical protein
LKDLRQGHQEQELTSWSEPGSSSPAGPTSPARGLLAWLQPTQRRSPALRRLGGCPASSRRLDGGDALPQLLGGYPSDLRHDRGRPLTPATRERNLYIWGSTASYDQRLKAPRGSARIRPLRRAQESVSISLATDASAGSLSRGGQSHRRDGEVRAAAPLTAWAGRLDEAGPSAPQKRLNQWALYGNGSPAGPLRRSDPPIVSSSPRSSRAWQALSP